MIEDDRVKLNKVLQVISDALTKGGKLYKSCLIFHKFTANIDKQISVCLVKLASISQSFDPNVTPTNNVDGKFLALNDKISRINTEKDKILRRVGELHNLIAPWLDTMLSNKVDCMKAMAQPVSSDLREVEIHATVFSAFITILDNLKNE